MKNPFSAYGVAVAAAGAMVLSAAPAQAVITYSVSGSWDSDARRTAALNALATVAGLYNAYGDFGNHNINAIYDSSVATADCGYYGQIRFGGTYPNQRVTEHESNHYMGSGTYSGWAGQFNASGVWTGAKMNALIQQFDGVGAVIRQSGVHFYGYGLNYDSEVVNNSIFPRNIALMYAMRQDMGNGNSADPWSARTVTLKQSDALGTSSFNWTGGWNDTYFAHPNADYYSGNYLVRTPVDTYDPSAATPSFTFAGDSLTLNNRGDANAGLLFKGVGTTGVTTINNLILDHGTIRHGSGAGDVLQLAGRVKVLAPSLIAPTNGSLNINSVVSGAGGLTIDDGAGTVTFTNAANTYRGNLDVKGKFTLATAATLVFGIGQNGVTNTITGTSADAVALNGTFNFDLSAAGSTAASQWAIVTAINTTYGTTFAVSGFTETTAGLWTNTTGYAFSETTGRLTFGGSGLTPIPEPASLAVLGMAGASLAKRRRR